jgi:hypothetical protein
LDKKWNAKVSDFGLAKLLGSGKSYVTTRVMGTFGLVLSSSSYIYFVIISLLSLSPYKQSLCRYVSPEYASTGMLNEGSDVYSFGILLMELVTGRSPIDYSRAPAEVNSRFL